MACILHCVNCYLHKRKGAHYSITSAPASPTFRSDGRILSSMTPSCSQKQNLCCIFQTCPIFLSFRAGVFGVDGYVLKSLRGSCMARILPNGLGTVNVPLRRVRNHHPTDSRSCACSAYVTLSALSPTDATASMLGNSMTIRMRQQLPVADRGISKVYFTSTAVRKAMFTVSRNVLLDSPDLLVPEKSRSLIYMYHDYVYRGYALTDRVVEYMFAARRGYVERHVLRCALCFVFLPLLVTRPWVATNSLLS